MNNSYITIIKEKRTVLSRKRVPLNQNECTAYFRIGVPFEQNLQTWLITKTRDSTKFPLIAEENAIFGFSYNLLGLKAHGITVSCIGIITNIILMYLSFTDSVSINISKILVGFVIHFLFLLLWIFIITKKLVVSSGQKYARALLSACDSNDID